MQEVVRAVTMMGRAGVAVLTELEGHCTAAGRALVLGLGADCEMCLS